MTNLLLFALLFLWKLFGSGEGISYNQLRQKSAHNTYDRDEEYADVLLHHHCRSVEFDIHNAKSSGVFDIYHEHPWDGSDVKTLADGVKVLSQFHNLNPSHQVVTVWVDIKDFLDADHTAENFDQTISILPLYTPMEAKGAYSSISEGISATGWPTTDSLLGRFIFIITDNTDCARGCYVANESEANSRAAFVAYRDMATYSTSPYKVVYNLEYTNRELSKTVYQNGFLTRVYKSGDGIVSADEVRGEVQVGYFLLLLLKCVHPALVALYYFLFPSGILGP